MARRPRIDFLLGDPNGVGPEMGARLLADAAVRDAAAHTATGTHHHHHAAVPEL